MKGGRLSANVHRQRLRTLRAFWRIIEWVLARSSGPQLDH
jgi:hypothetical protein